MGNLTQVYLVRHAEQLKIKNKIVKNESNQISNEKIILSVAGEKEAEKISELEELKNIDILWSSNYVRAISTAKYIAEKNNIEINIDESFNEENYGDLKSLEELGKIKKESFTIEQLLDETLKNKDGESREEVANRMKMALEHILKENSGKNIAVVSHGAAIKFLLMNWCNLNKNNQIEFKDKIITLNSPGVIKLVFDDMDLKELFQIV